MLAFDTPKGKAWLQVCLGCREIRYYRGEDRPFLCDFTQAADAQLTAALQPYASKRPQRE